MGFGNNTNIVLMTYQYSVIVRGIENKLNEKGYNVTTIEDKIAEVREHIDSTELFLINLPVDFNETSREFKELTIAINIIDENKKKMILIGEKRNHESYVKNIPSIAGNLWVDRPVDIDILAEDIEKVLGASSEPKVERSILIVDDDPAYAKMVREWIRDYYKISIVTAGMQAIKFLMKNKVDLILLDYEMPVVDGPQILEMLKSEPDTADIPVVFLTGIGTRESLQRVVSLKPSGYILKTATRDDLLKYINNLFADM